MRVSLAKLSVFSNQTMPKYCPNLIHIFAVLWKYNCSDPRSRVHIHSSTKLYPTFRMDMIRHCVFMLCRTETIVSVQKNMCVTTKKHSWNTGTHVETGVSSHSFSKWDKVKMHTCYYPMFFHVHSYTPRTLRACCSQSKFRILKIRESGARALFLYNCTPNISRSADASVSVA